MKPLLSIVIPTKDRYQYLFCLLKLIDRFCNAELEVVIQDNTKDNKEILSFIESELINRSCFKYYHTTENLSVVMNSDLAILNSSGEYISFIGDDDGVVSSIIDCVRWMKRNHVDVVVPSVVRYLWPDFVTRDDTICTGELFIKEQYTCSVACKDIDKVLSDSLKHGFVTRGALPLLYHGIVNREVLNVIYKKCNTFFPGPSPDIANGVAMCFAAKKYMVIDFPIIISGISKMGGGGVRLTKKLRVESIDSLEFLPKETKEQWEYSIPKIWSNETIWPESAIKALRRMGREDLIRRVNFAYMLSVFTVVHPDLFFLAWRCSNNKVSFIITLFTYISKKIGFRIYRVFTKTTDEQIKIENIKNINDAASVIEKKFGNFSTVINVKKIQTE